MRTHVDFAVADVLVRLNFDSDSLRSEFERYFPHTPQNIKPAAVVEVRHNVISAAHPSSGLLPLPSIVILAERPIRGRGRNRYRGRISRAFIDTDSDTDADPDQQTSIMRIPVPLRGEDEYEGIFNESTGVARVHLAGPYPINALANFLRRVCQRLIMRNKGLVLHGACIVRDGKAYLFCGPSRAGKTTVCRLSAGCEIVSDDLTAVRRQNGHFLAWGLPAPNTYHLFPNTEHLPKKVRAAFRLVQDNAVAVSPITPAEAAAAFLAIPQDDLCPNRIGDALRILDYFTNTVPCYELRFAKDPSFWEYIDREFGN